MCDAFGLSIMWLKELMHDGASASWFLKTRVVKLLQSDLQHIPVWSHTSSCDPTGMTLPSDQRPAAVARQPTLSTDELLMSCAAAASSSWRKLFMWLSTRLTLPDWWASKGSRLKPESPAAPMTATRGGSGGTEAAVCASVTSICLAVIWNVRSWWISHCKPPLPNNPRRFSNNSNLLFNCLGLIPALPSVFCQASSNPPQPWEYKRTHTHTDFHQWQMD